MICIWSLADETCIGTSFHSQLNPSDMVEIPYGFHMKSNALIWYALDHMTCSHGTPYLALTPPITEVRNRI